ALCAGNGDDRGAPGQPTHRREERTVGMIGKPGLPTSAPAVASTDGAMEVLRGLLNLASDPGALRAGVVEYVDAKAAADAARVAAGAERAEAEARIAAAEAAGADAAKRLSEAQAAERTATQAQSDASARANTERREIAALNAELDGRRAAIDAAEARLRL